MVEYIRLDPFIFFPYFIPGEEINLDGNTIFRVYVERYLTSLPVVNQDLDLIISQLQATEYGVPVQIYFFSRNKIWKEYERIQSDIFDHFFDMIPKSTLQMICSFTGVLVSVTSSV